MKNKLLNFNLSNPNNELRLRKMASDQLVYFRTQSISDKAKECERLLLKFFNCPQGRVIFLTGSGTMGMEALVSNLLTRQDQVLVVNGGTFGQRWVDICHRYRLNTHDYKVEFGKNIDIRNLISKINEVNPSYVLMQHVETSSGQLNDVRTIGEVCKSHGSKLIVDAMTGFMIHSTDMQDCNIYATVTSSNKGLCLYPGMAFIVLSEKATQHKFSSLSLYWDFTKYLKDFTEMYFPFTPNTLIINQLYEKLKRIDRSGVENQLEKVRRIATAFRNKIKDLPLTIVSETPTTCCTVLYTQRTDVKRFFERMKRRNVFFTPSGGPAGKLFFVGHMGDLIASDYDFFVRELGKWLHES